MALGASSGSSCHQAFKFSGGFFLSDATNQSNFAGQALERQHVKLPFAIALTGIESGPIKITHSLREGDDVA